MSICATARCWRRCCPFTARQFARAIVMPNLAPPVTTSRRRAPIASASWRRCRRARDFTPLMTCYLTDGSDPDEIARGYRGRRLRRGQALSGACHDQFGARRHRSRPGHAGAGAHGRDRHAAPGPWRGRPTPTSTCSTARRCSSTGCSTRCAAGCPNCASSSSTSRPRRRCDYVEHGGANLAATITAHHLTINRNALFAGGLRPHLYCLPIAKREKHRLALRRAATSGDPHFFLGTDSAPHRGSRPKKPRAAAPASSPRRRALEIYAAVFEEEGALDRLEAFASLNGPAFYRLPVNRSAGDAAVRAARRAAAHRRRRDRDRPVSRRRHVALASCWI